MKKVTIFFGIILALPVLLNAQYMGGIGNGDATAGISNVPLPVQKISVELPAEYELYQNYPNPFNPVTKIKFDIATPNFNKGGQRGVSLKIFDICGKEIQTLVNEQLQPGSYEVTFDGGNLPSGVYFYQLRMGDYIEVKKMSLIK